MRSKFVQRNHEGNPFLSADNVVVNTMTIEKPLPQDTKTITLTASDHNIADFDEWYISHVIAKNDSLIEDFLPEEILISKSSIVLKFGDDADTTDFKTVSITLSRR